MRLKYFVFLLLLVSLVGIKTFPQKYASRQAARLFGNTTYVVGNEHGAQTVTMVNGVHDEPYLHVQYDDKYVYGDFNRDGLKDAAVILIENTGGNADWYTLAFLMNDGEKLIHKASRELDDRAIINSMREKNDNVLIDMFVHQEGDCMGGPTKRVRNIYSYDGPDNWRKIKESPYQRIYADGIRYLQGIYQTPFSLQIRKTFDQTVCVDHDSSLECVFTTPGEEKAGNIFSRKFIIVDLERDDVGSVTATLVFEGLPNPFLLWINDIGNGRHELRKIAELPGSLGEGFTQQLQNPSYQRYWM